MNKPLRTRAGFTLIELLIVMAIIGVLAALLLAGISAARNRGYNLRETNDLKQLEIAIESFKKKYNMYPPSKLILYPARSDYEANKATPLVRDSLQVINRMFPNIGTFTYINWASTKNPPPAGFPSTGIILEADQCLVWALGGVYDPNQSGCMGFASGAKNPTMDLYQDAAQTKPLDRRKDFDFPAGRLVTSANSTHSWTASKSAMFPSFIDNYGQMPYIYFAPSLPQPGSPTSALYNNAHAVTINYNDGQLPKSDLVSPYYDGSKGGNNYWNPKTFQIITAGYDGRFGSLGDWQNGTSPATGRFWADNRANFSSIVLGTAAQ